MPRHPLTPTRPPIRRAKPAARGRGGRPSRDAAEHLGEKILEVATALFLKHGYGATSVEMVAKGAGIAKRTFYHRFPDKAALFSAVVHGIVGRVRPANDETLFAGGTVDEILLRIAQAILRAALSPEALGLHRVIVAEAGRFPELAAAVAAQGASQEGIARIGAVLERALGTRGKSAMPASFAAAQFLFMMIALPQRRALGLGTPMTQAELDRWASDTVALFLDGWRGKAPR